MCAHIEIVGQDTHISLKIVDDADFSRTILVQSSHISPFTIHHRQASFHSIFTYGLEQEAGNIVSTDLRSYCCVCHSDLSDDHVAPNSQENRYNKESL